MTTSDIKDELSSIPGISDVEITLRDGKPPLARVWLDGTTPEEVVQERINALVGSDVPELIAETTAPIRRGGLGKGLDSLMPDADGDAVPSQLRGQLETRAASIERVAVVEHTGGVSVEIEDGAGHVVSVDVDESGSIDDAVIAAVRTLTGTPDDVIFVLGGTEVGGAAVVVATATNGERVVAGASVLAFGRPFALARAVRQAVASL